MHEVPPLSGFTVAITADRRWEEQAELLRRRGAAVLHGPTMRTLHLGVDQELRERTQELIEHPPEILIANTGIGMRAWIDAAESWGIGQALVGALRECEVLARGPKAAAAAHAAGLFVSRQATTERLDEIVEMCLRRGVSDQTIAFQLHGDDSPEITKTLTEAGARVVEVPVYRWRLPDDTGPAAKVVEAIVLRRVHAVTFTSAPGVANLCVLAEAEGKLRSMLQALNTVVLAMCVGEVCAGAARELGVADPVVPDRGRLGPMIRTLTDRLLAQRRSLGPITLAGNAVFYQDERFDVSATEGALLHRLSRRPGAVVSKSELIESVWGAGTDLHVVEVTAARLRRRLGPIGGLIEAVPKRGYRLRVPPH